MTKRFFVIAAAVIAVSATALAGCEQVECGEGTVDKNGVCVPVNVPDATDTESLCGPGSYWNDDLGQCFVDPAEVCGPGTEVKWNEEHTSFVCTSTGQSDLPECPPPDDSGNICINGWIKWLVNPDDETSFIKDTITDASLLSTMEIVIYDPLDYASVGSESQPLGYATIDPATGTFIATGIQVPGNGYIGIVVRDKGWNDESEPVNWAFTGHAYKTTAGENRTGLVAVAVSKELLDRWRQRIGADFMNGACPQHDLYECGTWIGIYREVTTGQTIDGVSPLYGQSYFDFPVESTIYLDKDEHGQYTVFTPASVRPYTSETGVVFYLGADLTNYYGICSADAPDSLCNQWGLTWSTQLQGGSAQRTLFVEYLDAKKR